MLPQVDHPSAHAVHDSFPQSNVNESLKHPTLRLRLEAIAARNEGHLVPLHGRLFAQWLHYAFPRDCPYPHEVGSVNTMTIGEWLKESKNAGIDASEEMMYNLTLQPHALMPPSPMAGAKMWSAKEELLASSTPSDGLQVFWMKSALGM